MPPIQASFDREQFSAGLLRIYLYYRFLLSLMLLAAFALGLAPQLLGRAAPELFMSTAIIYVVISAITLGFFQLQHHRLRPPQLFITLFADIAAQTILMYCSGGLPSGIGYLLLVTVAAGAIFFTGQMAVLIPAVASLCIIAESIISAQVFHHTGINIFAAGILGVLLFITSLIFSKLSKALLIAQQATESEAQFSESLQQLNQVIINRMRTGILVVDEAAIIQQINQAARELLGTPKGSHPLTIGDSLRHEARLLKRLLRWKRDRSHKPETFVPRFGNLEVQANFAALENGDADRIIIFLEDMHAATQQAQQLKLAALGRLTGSIAHEIRNPLGAISHASELLGELRSDDQTSTRLTTIIDTHVKRVNHIVESVLQLSRKQDHRPKKLDLDLWLKHFLADFKLGDRTGAVIDVEISPQSGDYVTFDPIHLQQVLTNLVDNAIRYSRESTGEPWAAIKVSSQGEERLTNLDVYDRGPGVSQEIRSKLFEPFFTTSQGGSGLGLYIARELCAINLATLKYQTGRDGEPHYFRITFVHPDKIVKLAEDGNEIQ